MRCGLIVCSKNISDLIVSKADMICYLKIDKGVLNKILSQANIKPHKVSYYLEKRDPEFETKMASVLQVYKEIAIINETPNERTRTSTTLSYAEKPGNQAIKNIAPQLQPVPGEHPTLQRDHEYKRLGALSRLAGIDLHTGKVMSVIRERHRSKEFIEFLELADKQYPSDWKVRVILIGHLGNIVNVRVPRPSDERIKTEIRQLLDNLSNPANARQTNECVKQSDLYNDRKNFRPLL